MFSIDDTFDKDFVAFYVCVDDKIDDEAKKTLLEWRAAQTICLFDAFKNDETENYNEFNDNDTIVGSDEINEINEKEKNERKPPETQFTKELIAPILKSSPLKQFELISIHDLSILFSSLRDNKSMINEWNIQFEEATKALPYNRILLIRLDLSCLIGRNLVLEKKPNKRFLHRIRK